ncbi:hypothetical protein HYPSUDRAFT_59588 [Hypholoma sublateritium FD-334 SS-4]|uniref:Uncharacterized protein n=1 Tax=Hypholoma sublateritium (strain FD-334 SS-4) TaxID=945553 RepID=A0A0D2KHE0_HYPSF|nr:hypothetical protein HYPSUDRAFT_59588 [Hypholoma sublateritium FD-334 SS-4]
MSNYYMSTKSDVHPYSAHAPSHTPPPTASAPSSHAPPVAVQHTHTTDHQALTVSHALSQESAQVQVHLSGPAVTWLVEEFGANLHLTTDALATRIRLSRAAYTRRIIQFGQDPALRAPSAGAVEINMCYADYSVGMDVTREALKRTLGRLALPNSGDLGHCVSEWVIVCRRCGEGVTHYYADELWNGRYIAHRRDPRCTRKQMKLRLAQ